VILEEIDDNVKDISFWRNYLTKVAERQLLTNTDDSRKARRRNKRRKTIQKLVFSLKV
jgi:hypothetical protein